MDVAMLGLTILLLLPQANITPVSFYPLRPNHGMVYSVPDQYTEEEFRDCMERLANSDMESAEVARKILESI